MSPIGGFIFAFLAFFVIPSKAASFNDYTEKMVQAACFLPFDDDELILFSRKRLVVYDVDDHEVVSWVNKGRDNLIWNMLHKKLPKQFYEDVDAVTRVPGSKNDMWIFRRPYFKDGEVVEANATVVRYTVPGDSWGKRSKHTYSETESITEVFPGLIGTDFAAGVSDATLIPDGPNGPRMMFFNRYTFGIYDLINHKLEGAPRVLFYAYPKTKGTGLANNTGMITNTMSLTGGPDAVTHVPGTNKLILFRNQFFHELDLVTGEVKMMLTKEALPGLA